MVKGQRKRSLGVAAPLERHRTEYGYFLLPDDVNAYWMKAHGHACPYMDPLPIVVHMRKKEMQRAKANQGMRPEVQGGGKRAASPQRPVTSTRQPAREATKQRPERPRTAPSHSNRTGKRPQSTMFISIAESGRSMTHLPL